ncbi:MAG: hypothetical protein HFF06_08410 [Oscillospiraceae bacterium]|nr:hypothetical protein [Oscillospiraceae bacterium]
MTLSRRLLCLSLCTALLLPAGALAAEYPDLDQSHWAYQDMNRAVELGIIRGMEDGRMAPEGTLTWGQYLTMLSRAFFPEDYAAYLEAGQEWDRAGYLTALDHRLLLEEDFLPADPSDLWAPILRQDAAVLLDRALPEDSGGWDWHWSSYQAEVAFADWESLGEAYHDAVSRLFHCGITKGREVEDHDPALGLEDSLLFGGGENIKRADGTVLLLRTLYEADMTAERDVTVTLHIVDQQGTPLTEPQVVETQTGRHTYELVDENNLWHYVCISDPQQVSSYQSDYTLVYRPYTRREAAQEDFYAAVERGELSYEDYWNQDFNLWELGENPRKSLLLFGNEEQLRFSDRASAEASMADITVPVWKLDKAGNKVESTLTLTVHAALAQDVTAIFTEIFNDPEQFPFKDLGGYSWRGDSSNSEHNSGTAIDINWDENYQIRDGAILAGSVWAPGENPYSIGPDSSVVRIFEAYGWAWGGDAWAYDSDDSQGYHDYMHFSYLGT